VIAVVIGKPINKREDNSEPHNHKSLLASYIPCYEGINGAFNNVQTNEHQGCVVYFAVEYFH
jgi:hypothetical protein